MADSNQPYDPANDALQKAVKANDDGPTSAMSRALQKAYQSPPALVAQGLAHLEDPNNGLDYETKMAAVQPLLEAKHFGGPNPNGQGQISSAKQEKSGVGNLMGMASTAAGIYGGGAALAGGAAWGASKLGILNSVGAGGYAGSDSFGDVSGLA